MPDDIEFRDLDAPPGADRVARLREEAADQDESVGVTFPVDGTRKRFVVSPRGTCVVLKDTREDSFNPSVGAEDVAEALQTEE